MFEILETDIVVMQETKIQRRDLSDDMVLVPGWDVYFSLPKYKKGMSTSWIHCPQQQPLLTPCRLLWSRRIHQKLHVLSHTSGGGHHWDSLSAKVIDQLPRSPG